MASSRFNFLILLFLWLLPLLAVMYSCNDSGNVLVTRPDDSTSEEQPEQLMLEPSSVLQSGYVRIRVSGFNFEASADEIIIKVGSAKCIDLKDEDDGAISCIVRGSETPGKVDVLVGQDGSMQRLKDGLEYLPARDRMLTPLVVLGGGFAAGMQGAALSAHTQTHSFASLLASSMGSYFPLALVDSRGFPGTSGYDDVDTDNGILDEDWFGEYIKHFLDDLSALDAFKLDPQDHSYNLAVPFAGRSDYYINGLNPSMTALRLAHLLNLDDLLVDGKTLFAEIAEIQPELVVAGPEFFSYSSMIKVDGSSAPGLEDWEMGVAIDRFIEDFLKLDPLPYFFVVNSPPPNVFPQREYSEFLRYETIWINNAIHARLMNANARLVERGIGKRFFVVDFYDLLYRWSQSADSLDIAGQEYRVALGNNGEADLIVKDASEKWQLIGLDALEGFFSIDGYHLTDTGSAMLANLVIESINEAIGPDGSQSILAIPVPPVDLASVLKDDPFSPQSRDEYNMAKNDGIIFFPNYEDQLRMPPLKSAHQCAMDWMGERPSSELCPKEVRILTDNPYNAELAQYFEIEVFVSFPEEVQAGYPVVAKAINGGILLNDSAETDEEGYATFAYVAPQRGESARVIFYCGNEKKIFNVQLTEPGEEVNE